MRRRSRETSTRATFCKSSAFVIPRSEATRDLQFNYRFLASLGMTVDDIERQLQRLTARQRTPPLEQLRATFAHARELVVRQRARCGASVRRRVERECVVEFLGAPPCSARALAVERADDVLREQRFLWQPGGGAARSCLLDRPTARDQAVERVRESQL